jgi:NADH dehydrogenase (ubiquinone) Fe-S protein 6
LARGVKQQAGQAGLPSYKHGAHRSSAEKLVAEIPVIVVDDTVAVCDGGSGALGHPVEYIQLDTVSNKPQICKYCGLGFKMGEPHYH